MLTRVYYESGGGRQYYADEYRIDATGEAPQMVRVEVPRVVATAAV